MMAYEGMAYEKVVHREYIDLIRLLKFLLEHQELRVL
jgi:hypothetical protein